MLRMSISLALCLAFIPLSQAAFEQPTDNDGAPISTTVKVWFPDGGTRFRPPAEAAAALATANEAALVAIRGRTSTTTPSAKDETLALARAIAARSYLIARGVSPLKITLNYASAADFVADNATPEGRLQNQRVEIELVYVPF